MEDMFEGFSNTETPCILHGIINCLACEKEALKKEKEAFLQVCVSFVSFHATAGFCKIAKCNCVCKNPKAMIDMFDDKCDEWDLEPNCL